MIPELHKGLTPRKGHSFLIDPSSPESQVTVNSVIPTPNNPNQYMVEVTFSDGEQDVIPVTSNILLAYALTQSY